MSSSEGLCELMDSDDCDFRYSCGVTQATSKIDFKDRDSIVGAIAKHYAIMYCMTELIQLKDGLSSLRVLELLQANARVSKRLLVYSHHNILTADKLYDIFKADLAQEGSNLRIVQERVYFHWVNLMQEIEGV